MGEAGDTGEALIDLPGGDALAGGALESITGAAMDEVMGSVGLEKALGEVAGAVADEGHEVVGEGGDEELADAVFVTFDDFQIDVGQEGFHDVRLFFQE